MDALREPITAEVLTPKQREQRALRVLADILGVKAIPIDALDLNARVRVLTAILIAAELTTADDLEKLIAEERARFLEELIPRIRSGG